MSNNDISSLENIANGLEEWKILLKNGSQRHYKCYVTFSPPYMVIFKKRQKY